MNVTINIPDDLLIQADKNASAFHMKRSEYIRSALEHMNKQIIRNERYSRLQKLSKLVRSQSMEVNKEFEEGDLVYV